MKKNFIHCDEKTRSQQDSQHNVLRYINFRVLLHNSVVVVWLRVVGFLGFFFFWRRGEVGGKGQQEGCLVLLGFYVVAGF